MKTFNKYIIIEFKDDSEIDYGVMYVVLCVCVCVCVHACVAFVFLQIVLRKIATYFLRQNKNKIHKKIKKCK